jgi:hypothetical protein
MFFNDDISEFEELIEDIKYSLNLAYNLLEEEEKKIAYKTWYKNILENIENKDLYSMNNSLQTFKKDNR